MPITIFLDIVHLTTLELCSLSPDDFDGENSSLLTQAASKGVAPVIDRCVWHDWLLKEEHIDAGGPWTIEPIFLPLFICGLRFLEIYIDIGYSAMSDFNILSYWMGSLYISLISPATLERLEFNIRYIDFIDDFDFNTLYENLRDADARNHLDSITTHPAGSQLQRVDINFNFVLIYEDEGAEPDEDKAFKAFLDRLPLLCTKDILFVGTVVEWTPNPHIERWESEWMASHGF